jgi:hypothetical protein
MKKILLTVTTLLVGFCSVARAQPTTVPITIAPTLMVCATIYRLPVGNGEWREVAIPTSTCPDRTVTRIEIDPGDTLEFVDNLLEGVDDRINYLVGVSSGISIAYDFGLQPHARPSVAREDERNNQKLVMYRAALFDLTNIRALLTTPHLETVTMTDEDLCLAMELGNSLQRYRLPKLTVNLEGGYAMYYSAPKPGSGLSAGYGSVLRGKVGRRVFKDWYFLVGGTAYQPYTDLGTIDGAEVLVGISDITPYGSLELTASAGRATMEIDAQPTALYGVNVQWSFIRPISERFGLSYGLGWGSRISDPISDPFGGVTNRFWMNTVHVGIVVLPIK